MNTYQLNKQKLIDLMQQPKNLGKTLVTYKQASIYTTEIPVKKIK